MSPRFLYLETAETACTVTIFEGQKCLSMNTSEALRDQAARLAPEVRRTMSGAGLSFEDLACIVVHNGPGSYTGLRVSLSLAKGMCLATGLPLLAPTGHTLAARTWLAEHPDYHGRLAVLSDARRNDAYVTVFDEKASIISPARLSTMDHDWAVASSGERSMVLIGSGAAKCDNLLPECPNLCIDSMPLVSSYGLVIQDEYEHQRFADLVSVVPMYISPVNITKPRNTSL